MCLCNVTLRGQCNSLLYLPWISQMINFYNINEDIAVILN